MNAFEPLATVTVEAALRAFETARGVTVTVRDLAGVLNASGLDPARSSHQRQRVCALGFDARCIAHCRHAAGPACREPTAPLAHRCWKGVREVLVPIHRDGGLVGYLFAGAWRDATSPPGPWRAAWRALPAWDAHAATAIAAELDLLARGLLAAPTALLPGRAGIILAWIRAHLDHPRPRPGLARELGLSASRTSHAVREACGRSLETILRDERFAAARVLLATTDLTVAEVGARVGWGDPPHFTRSFRGLAGVSPGRWRREHRSA